MDIVFSDEEDAGQVGADLLWSDVKDDVIPFGAHQGTTYKDLLATTKKRSYLRWLLKWDELRPYTKAKIECALAEYKRLKEARSIELPPRPPKLERQTETLSRRTTEPVKDSDDDTDEIATDSQKGKKKRKRRKLVLV
jgi:hypothetical protein